MAGELDDSFLTVAEVAGILKLNQQTVRNWIDAGSLPALHVGRRVRIRRSDLERLIVEGYGSRAKATARGVDPGRQRLRDVEFGEVQHQTGPSLGTTELWHGFCAAAARLSETITPGNADEIAGAFRALADAARALGDAIASKAQDS